MVCEACEKSKPNDHMMPWTCGDCADRHLVCSMCAELMQRQGNARFIEADGKATPLLKLCPNTMFFRNAMIKIVEEGQNRFTEIGVFKNTNTKIQSNAQSTVKNLFSSIESVADLTEQGGSSGVKPL